MASNKLIAIKAQQVIAMLQGDDQDCLRAYIDDKVQEALQVRQARNTIGTTMALSFVAVLGIAMTATGAHVLGPYIASRPHVTQVVKSEPMHWTNVSQNGTVYRASNDEVVCVRMAGETVFMCAPRSTEVVLPPVVE